MLYVKDASPSQGPCWKAQQDGKETTYVRVVASISIPQPNEPRGCVLVLAEPYDPEGPPRFTALGARIGLWADLEGKLGALRRLLQPATFVVEPGGEALAAVRRMLPDLRKAAPHVPCALVEAPPDALGELGRQHVNELIREERLHLGRVATVLNESPEPAARALQVALGWCVGHLARYGPRSDLREQNRRRARSYFGRPPAPDEPIPVVPSLPTPRAGGKVGT